MTENAWLDPPGKDEEETEIEVEEDPRGQVQWATKLPVGGYNCPVNSDCYVRIYMDRDDENEGRAGGFWWGINNHDFENGEILSYVVERWVIAPEEEFENPGTQPVPNGTIVEVKLFCNDYFSAGSVAEQWAWSRHGSGEGSGQIEKYRIVRAPE